MKYKIPQLEPYIGEEELENLKKVIEGGWLTEGPFSEEFLSLIRANIHLKWIMKLKIRMSYLQ